MDVTATQQSMTAAMSDAQQAKAIAAEAANKQKNNRSLVLQLSNTTAAVMAQTQYVSAALAKTVDVATSLTQTAATFYKAQVKLAEEAIHAIDSLSEGASSTILVSMEAVASTAKVMMAEAQANIDAISTNASKIVQLSSKAMDLAQQLGPVANVGIEAAKVFTYNVTVRYYRGVAEYGNLQARVALNTAEAGLTLAMAMGPAVQETLRTVQQTVAQLSSNVEKVASGTIAAANLVSEAVRNTTPAISNIANVFLQGQINAMKVINELQPAARAAMEEAAANITASLQIANSVMSMAQAVVNRASKLSLKFDQITNSMVAKLGVTI